MTLPDAIVEAGALARRTKITAYIHRHVDNINPDAYNFRFGAPIEGMASDYVTDAIIFPDGRLFLVKGERI